MFAAIIPNFDEELNALNKLAPSGWIIGFNLTVYKGAEHIYTTYPPAWRERYEDRNYFFGDPIALWSMTQTGSLRWSEVRFPDLLGVLKEARQYGLFYGVVLAQKVNKKRSFLTLSRPDREFRDEEIAAVEAKFKVWSDLVLVRATLTSKEIDVLRCLRDGLEYSEVAAILGISEATVKQRAAKASLKLGAKNRIQAVAIAVSRKYI